MNSWQIECFIRVAETMNFRKAASVLHISQPALTKQVMSLENTLGVKLLNRDTTHVTLTDEGARFLERAVPLLNLMDATSTMFHESSHVIFNYFFAYGLPQVVNEFRARRPQTILQMLRLKMWGVTEKVVRRPDNVVIGRKSDLADIPGVEFVPLMEAEEYLVTSLSNPLAKRTKVTFEDLGDQTVIRSGSSLSSRDISIEGMRVEDRIKQCPIIGCDNLTEAIIMVKNDCGIAFFLLPEDMVTPDIARIPVVDAFTDTLGIGYVKKDETEDMRVLVDVLMKVYGDKSLQKILQ